MSTPTPPAPPSVPPSGPPGTPRPPGPQITDRHPLALALFGLTMASGLIDAVSYLGLGHVFTANMTGNVVVIAFALAGAPGFSLAASVTSLGAFLIGGVLAGRFTVGRPSGRLRAALVLEVALHGVAAAVAFAWNVEGPARYAVITLGAVAMGIRNGTVRALAVPDLTTTVLTLTLTGLATDPRLAGGGAPRQRRRLLSVATMLAGALPGAVLVLHGQLAWALVAGAALAGLTALLYRE